MYVASNVSYQTITWVGGTKLNGVNCRRLMDQHEIIINNIWDTFIYTNKGIVVKDNINMFCDKHKQRLNERDNTYWCIRSLDIILTTLYPKKQGHVKNTMLLWRESKLPVTSSAHLFKDHIVHRIYHCVGWLADKQVDHIENRHQNGKCSGRIYYRLTYVLIIINIKTKK